MIKFAKKTVLAAILLPIAVGILYLLAALVGGLIPSPQNIEQTSSIEDKNTIDLYLLSNVLHVDIAVPLTEEVKQQFAFLENDGFPFSHPKLEYLVVGWGSKQFYTSTKTLMDIGPGPVYAAVFGDTSVLHVIPSRDISNFEDVKKISVTRNGFDKMVKNIRATFALSTKGKPTVLKGINHEVSDLFYQAKGSFNIFHPCNTWTARMLRSAGVETGLWTPTTYSLMLSLD